MWQYIHTDNELYHYGVLGMRWGQRRARSSSGARRGLMRKRKRTYVSEDSKQASAIRKKKIKSMSNQELRDVNKRLELETKYRDLSSKSNAGKRAVKAVVAAGVTITGITTTYEVSKKLLSKAATKIGSKTIR